jgi:hypothetical protein
MTLFLVILGLGIIVLLVAMFVPSDKPKPAQAKQQSPEGARSERNWSKLQDSFGIPIALILILVTCWLAWPKQFNQVAITPGFWAGMILAILVGGILLRAAVPFKDSWIRKILLAGSFLVGIALISGSFIPWGKLEAFSQVQPTLAPQEIRLQVGPDSWTRWITEVPPHTVFNCYPPDDWKWVEYRLKNGDIIHSEKGGRCYTKTAKGDSLPGKRPFPTTNVFSVRSQFPGTALIKW